MLPPLNFALMSATTLKVFGFRGYWMFALIPLAFLVVWTVGYFFDRAKVSRANEEQSLNRSIAWEWRLKDREMLKEILRELRKRGGA